MANLKLELLIIWLTSTFSLVLAQDDTPECGLTCIADVSNTTCGQSQWTCLCQNNQYLENVNMCARQGCNQTDYDTTISGVAQICAIFSLTPTISPYETATTETSNPIFSTVATSTSPTSSGTTSNIDSIIGTSVSTFTTTGVTSSSGAMATASATTTNIAKRVDLRKSAVLVIGVALLGLAFYL